MRFNALWLYIPFSLLMVGCKVDLLNGISQRQANEVLSILQRNDIDAEKLADGKKGFKVSVEKQDFADAVGLLQQHQLPSREDVAIAELFPADSLVTTPTSERARLLSAIEQRLEKTVNAIDAVTSARVHVSYPIQTVKDGASRHRVAVMVQVAEPGREPLLQEKIRRIVRNSFDAVEYDDISVIVFERTFANDFVYTRATLADRAPLFYIAGAASLCTLLAAAIAAGAYWIKRRRSRIAGTFT